MNFIDVKKCEEETDKLREYMESRNLSPVEETALLHTRLNFINLITTFGVNRELKKKFNKILEGEDE